MFGDRIYARTISGNVTSDKAGRAWQYHPRSDAHSKAACWAILFDVLLESPLLREHVKGGKVGFGINHFLHDYRLNRKKNLDLVVCTPSGDPEKTRFASLAKEWSIPLTAEEEKKLDSLPALTRCPVGTTLVALEAKACMTEHSKARPRLYDELSSSFQTILGDTRSAIAGGFVSINISDSFISPLRNKPGSTDPTEITYHDQPKAASKVLEKVSELPRRADEDGVGFDALGVVLVDCRNDGSDVTLEEKFQDGQEIPSILRYETLVKRIAAIYASRFRAL